MKYLFCPLASHGFVYPAIGVARALHRRGHEVAFVTGSAFSEVLEQAGIERIPCGTKDTHSFEVETWAHPLSAAMQVKHIEYGIKRFAPDVLVGSQLATGPLIASELHALPVAVIGLAVYLWPFWFPDRAPQSKAEERAAWRYKEMLRHYNDVRPLFGLPPSHAHYLESPFLGDLFMLQSVPAFEAAQYPFPTQVRLVGGCLWEPPGIDLKLEQWLREADAAAEPVLYVQPGRSFQTQSFWSHLVATLRDKPIRVVASTGRMDKEAGTIPANFYVRQHVSQGQVLPYAQALVSGGHTTSVLGALRHGLPSLLLPTGSGTDDLAEHCQRAGVAISISAEAIDAALLGRAVEELLSSKTLRVKAIELQRCFEEWDGCERAAKLLSDPLNFTREELLEAVAAQ